MDRLLGYLYILPPLFDLLALVTVLGVLSCRLWVLPPKALVEGHPQASTVWIPLRRLLARSLVVLTATSFLSLLNRAAEMSGESYLTAFPVLPTVLLQTHYGLVWLIRAGALLALWVGWWAMAKIHWTHFAGFMFGMAALIAWSYSATGHAADFGDFTWTQWIDWVHVMSGSMWGGSILAIALAIRPQFLRDPRDNRVFIAEIGYRASRLAGAALILVLASGVYNSVVHLTNWESLWTTAYGGVLTVKIGLVFGMIFLGTINRYLEIPRLERWRPPDPKPAKWPMMSRLVRRIVPKRKPRRGNDVAHRLLNRVAWEAILMALVVLCAAVLLRSAPPHHSSGMEHHEHHSQ